MSRTLTRQEAVVEMEMAKIAFLDAHEAMRVECSIEPRDEHRIAEVRHAASQAWDWWRSATFKVRFGRNA